MPDLDETSDKVHDALSGIIREDRQAMLSKWVTLMEVIDENGERSLWSLTSDGLSMWDRLGMVEFHSRLIHPECGRDDEDDES